jgi:hypothetical protein
MKPRKTLRVLSIAAAVAGGGLLGGCMADTPDHDPEDAPGTAVEEAAAIVALTPCGDAFCEGDEFCCNESCSICAPVDGGSCTMQLCEDDGGLAEICGDIVCPVGQVCCDEDCGICAADQDACPALPCEPVELIPCGESWCGVGEFCCNESCGVCAPVGGSCTMQLCDADPQLGERCGDTMCPSGTICCDETCGVCAKAEDACPPMTCAPAVRPMRLVDPTLADPTLAAE